jgi:hypothetical protein
MVADHAPAPPAIHIRGVRPAFARDIQDYATRHCRRIVVRVRRRAASVDGSRPRTGRFPVRLRPGQAFRIVEAGRTHTVRCLPRDFPHWSFEQHRRAAEKVYLFSPSVHARRPYVIAIDGHGTPLWWRRTPIHEADQDYDFKDLRDGTVIWWRRVVGGDLRFEQHGLDGRLIRTWRTVGGRTDGHDFEQLRNGNALMITYEDRENVDLSAYGLGTSERLILGEVQEISPDGKLVWSWSTKGHIARSETGRWWPYAPQLLYDLSHGVDTSHVNAVEPVPGGFLFSGRHLDAIYKVARPSGRIVWKLGGTHTRKSLRVIGLQGLPLGGQHDVRRLPDGTITVADNSTRLRRPPRGLRFRINERKRTATLVERVVDPALRFSLCCGSARRLRHGHWLLTFGINSEAAELTAKGKPVWRLRMTKGTYSYRFVPARYVTRTGLRAGMDAQYPR